MTIGGYGSVSLFASTNAVTFDVFPYLMVSFLKDLFLTTMASIAGSSDKTAVKDELMEVQQNGLSNGKLTGRVDQDGTIILDEEDEEEEKFYQAAVQHIIELERRRELVDSKEGELRAQLKGIHEREREAMKSSSDFLGEKESLRDELISLKEKKERLIDETDILVQVDSEMRAFSKLNEGFNETLNKHLSNLNERQAKIYTIKPMISGKDVEINCDLSVSGAKAMNESIIAAIKLNTTRVKVSVYFLHIPILG